MPDTPHCTANAMKQVQTGHTLLELLATVAIVGVLSALVVPAVLASAARVRVAEVRAQLTAAVFTAQREATLRGKVVMLCPGRGRCAGDAPWHDGWELVVDGDGDRAAGASDHVIGRQPALSPGVGVVTTAGRARLLFHPNAGNAGSNATFTLCERSERVPAQSLVLANDGRLRARPALPGARPACAASARARD